MANIVEVEARCENFKHRNQNDKILSLRIETDIISPLESKVSTIPILNQSEASCFFFVT